MKPYSVALVDDHTMIRTGLAELINTFNDYQVLFHAGNFDELTENLNGKRLPDIILLDINLPGKNGYEIAQWLRNNQPEVKVCALSMYDNELSIIRMLKNGVRGYLLKASPPAELRLALDSIIHKGYHYSDLLTGHLLHSVQQDSKKNGNDFELNEREMTFLRYASTEMTYKEIGTKMFLSARTIDGYRDKLCEKLHVGSRIGLVLYAIKNRIVDIEDTAAGKNEIKS
jgi:DNA-binding NarL/FixJ family response regulator